MYLEELNMSESGQSRANHIVLPFEPERLRLTTVNDIFMAHEYKIITVDEARKFLHIDEDLK
jgi:hypothetical protein